VTASLERTLSNTGLTQPYIQASLSLCKDGGTVKGWRFGRLSFHHMMPRASIVSSRSPRLSRVGNEASARGGGWGKLA